MAKFKFTELVQGAQLEVISACIGSAAEKGITSGEVGKAVKLSANDTYKQCAAGDEIEGFISSIDAKTFNEGYAFGGVRMNGRKLCTVDASIDGTTGKEALAVGDLVVAGTQKAEGTDGDAVVKGGSPSDFKWRVIRVDGDGKAGDTVLIEKV